MPIRKTGLYLHVPFCRNICAYCDFKRVVNDDRLRLMWMDALKQEIDSKQDILGQCYFDTLYLGGGTPSVLTMDELTIIMGWLKPYLSTVKEATIEANSEDIDDQWIDGILRLGFNRLSIGLESDDFNQLMAMRRKSNYQTVKHGINRAKAHGLTNINVDLIYGLPDSTMEKWQATMKHVMDLDVPHISMYALSLEENSIWGKNHVKPVDDELMADMMEQGIQWLHQCGYTRYEISNFTKNQPSLHNLHYWHYDDFIGLGYGSSGKWLNHRYDHCDHLMPYLKGNVEWMTIEETLDDMRNDYIMMNTRLKQRFDFKVYNDVFHDDFYQRYHMRLKQCKIKGYIDYDRDGLTMTDYGLDCQFSFLSDLLD